VFHLPCSVALRPPSRVAFHPPSGAFHRSSVAFLPSSVAFRLLSRGVSRPLRDAFHPSSRGVSHPSWPGDSECLYDSVWSCEPEYWDALQGRSLAHSSERRARAFFSG